MRMKFILWPLVLVGMLAIWGIESVFADGLSWEIPGGIGTVQLPTQATDIIPLVGYDFVKKQTITGASASVMTLFKEINGYVGAVGEWQTQAPNIQPYVGAGLDVTKYIPGFKDLTALQIQGFVRYVASEGNHLGSGVAISYKFGDTPQTPVTP